MNIGIISSGNENVLLFTHLNQYRHTYTVYYDQNNSFLGDKDFIYAKNKIQKGIEVLQKQGCEKVIIDPIFELYFLQENKYIGVILPLFTDYLHQFCFKNSLIGKIGIIGDHVSTENVQEIIKNEEKKYQLTENQKNTKKFHFPFSYWVKETRMRKYFLNNLSFSHYMVNKVIKFDLRYFKDANIDTLIPLNYGYFAYQNTITKFFNQNKQKFHAKIALEKVIKENLETSQEKEYTITVIANGHTHFLKDNKKLLRLLQKGNTHNINFIHQE